MKKTLLVLCYAAATICIRAVAFAQSCPLCRLALINSPEGRKMAGAFNFGILFLLAAPYLLVGLLALLLMKLHWGSISEIKKAFQETIMSNPYFRQKKPAPLLLWGIALLLVILMTATNVVGAWLYSRPLSNAQNLPVYGKVAPFSLIERNGAKFTEKKLSGKVWVADFIFTRCPDECPLLSTFMARLQSDFIKNKTVSFVSFSIDPRYDTAKILSEYAKRFGAIKGKWFFLTGNEKKIYSLVEKNFHLPIVQDPNETLNPRRPPEIGHTTKFMLVDQKGNIRGYYDGNSTQGIALLRRDIETLEK